MTNYRCVLILETIFKDSGLINLITTRKRLFRDEFLATK